MTYRSRNPQGEQSAAASLAPRPKRACAVWTDESLPKGKARPPQSAAGFLLVDSSFDPIYFNAEAAQILGYPNDIGNLAASKSLLGEKIRSSLISAGRPGDAVFVGEFRSGRRRYFCRGVPLDSQGKETFLCSMAILLERGPSRFIALGKVAERCNLTRREREVLEYLLHGMSGREIANRMNLSLSTVKAFLRLIMIKMRVPSRSAVIVKILMTEI